MNGSRLSDREIAEAFLVFGGRAVFTIDAVEGWLTKMGIGHRSAIAVVREVDQIQAEAEPERSQQLQSPEQAAWEQNQNEGFGDAPLVQRHLAQFLMAN